MMSHNYNGIKFYSSKDLSCGHSLEKVETLLQTFDLQKEYTEINNIIELFNIKRFFDMDLRLTKWTDVDFNYYKKTVNNFDKIIAKFFSKINETNFIKYLEDVDIDYVDDFWFLLNYFRIYEDISEYMFSQALQESNIRYILHQKNLVNYYGEILVNYLVSSTDSAVLLMDQFLVDDVTSQSRFYFPQELTSAQKEKILLNYIRSNQPNPNYLDLIARAQNTVDLPIHDKIKLEARKKYDEYVSSFFSENSGFLYGAQAIFSKSQKEEVIFDNTDAHTLSYIYGTKWIEENQDFPTLLNNFIYLFGYVDHFFRSQFVSQPAQLGAFEAVLGVKGKKDYVIGIQFQMAHMLFNAQMVGYINELSRLNIKLESIFKWFFEIYLCNEFHANGFVYNAPSDSTTDLEKCKLLASEIDSILKQFTLFVTDGYIDRDLFEISSGQLFMKNIPSFCKEKYIYPKNEICKNSMWLLLVKSILVCKFLGYDFVVNHPA